MDTWRYDVRTWYPPECAPFIGNGACGGTIPLDGHDAARAGLGMSLAGHLVGADEVAANAPHWLSCAVRVDGKPIYAAFVRYRQRLDLRRGVIETTYIDRCDAVRVTTRTFCHRGRPELACYRITVEALRAVVVEIEPALDAASCRIAPRISPLAIAAASAWTLDFADPERPLTQAIAIDADAAVTPIAAARRIGGRVRHALVAGQTAHVGVAVALAGSATAVAGAIAHAHAQGYAALEDEHAAAMARLWDSFVFEAEDPLLERRARGQLFWLIAGYRHDRDHGGTLTGVASGSGWGGGTYWDTEFFMLPALMPCFPDLSAAMLRYRGATLPAALASARASGEAGARFAWRSGRTGRGLDGAFEDQRHISTGIAFAAWWQARATGNAAFTREVAAPIVLAVARNIASRAQSGADGRFHLRGVVPPDEHVLDHHVGAPVDDSVMTNAYAAWCLRVAADDASVAPYEACRWRDIADRMHLPRDDARGLWLEYEGYDGHPIKQADVAHLWWPLRFNDDADDIRRNCAYYLAREDETALHLMHGIAAYGVAAARAADVAGVARAWRGSARNRVGPYEMPTESDWNSGAPYVASAGSFLCLLQYGALGIDTQGERFAARPCLPPEIGRIALGGIRFRGERWRVAATPGEPAQLTRAAAAGGGR